MYSHPHFDERWGPGFVMELLLRIERGIYGFYRGGKRCTKRISSDFIDVSLMSQNRLGEDLIVSRHQARHLIGILLGKQCATFDIGK
jgi:hypothetical protein